MTRKLLVALTLASLIWAWAIPPAAGAADPVPDPTFRAVQTVSATGHGRRPGPSNLPLHPRALARAKTVAAAHAAVPTSLRGRPATAPVSTLGFEGQADPRLTPPDSTGAIGPTRYVQLVNLRYGIYDRSGTRLAQGGLDGFTGIPDSFLGPCLSDPQVIWDADGQRFYYLALDVCDNSFAFGFSTSASPSAAAGTDWCRYLGFDYGLSLPDYPKLGDSSEFILIGANIFLLGAIYQGSDVAWIDKASLALGTGGSCPDPAGIGAGLFQGLQNADGSPASTPVPANGVDPSPTAYVVAGPDASSSPGGVASTLTVFRVTRNATTGAAQISAPGTVSVPSYAVPAPAPQRGTSKTLDTNDARLTQAVAAVDPNRNGKTAVWTQHTVFGGAGAMVRWYELNPGNATKAPSRFQTGVAKARKKFVFNAAVSPDRAVSPGGSAFGMNMVMTFNTSGSRAFPAIRMVSKLGRNSVSPWVLVRQSPGKNVDGSCSPECRWGDYAGASPDPAADLSGATGIVWLTNQWNVKSLTGSDVDWRTQIWSVTP